MEDALTPEEKTNLKKAQDATGDVGSFLAAAMQLTTDSVKKAVADFQEKRKAEVEAAKTVDKNCPANCMSSCTRAISFANSIVE